MGERPVTQWHGIILAAGLTAVLVCAGVVGGDHASDAAEAMVMEFTARVEFGEDVGQNFGSLFEAPAADGRMVVGAGFVSVYNTMFRGDRYTVQFFVRPAHGQREFAREVLPRPGPDAGTYLFDLEGKLYSYSHAHERVLRSWNEGAGVWEVDASPSDAGRMRLGDGMLVFADGEVRYDGDPILTAPEQGAYHRFYYAHGHLFFYHTYWAEQSGYRAYEADGRGFSKLYACPWTPGSGGAIDLARATVSTLPCVGETPFAYGQLGGDVLTCSNIGGLYLFDGEAWRTLVEPELDKSYQIYSMVNLYDTLLMGQYPTGLLYEFDGESVKLLEGWPPRLEGVVPHAREAQTTAIYGGELFVGVWPWGELWRYSPDARRWYSMGRMFTHPPVTDETTHPYERECQTHELVLNQWGQRVASLVPLGDSLMVSTSAKWPCEWKPEFEFLPDGKWQEYGSVIRLSTPGNLCAPIRRVNGATELQFVLTGSGMRILQDGEQVAATQIGGELAAQVAGMSEIGEVTWGRGVFGAFGGAALEGRVRTSRAAPQ